MSKEDQTQPQINTEMFLVHLLVVFNFPYLTGIYKPMMSMILHTYRDTMEETKQQQHTNSNRF